VAVRMILSHLLPLVGPVTIATDLLRLASDERMNGAATGFPVPQSILCEVANRNVLASDPRRRDRVRSAGEHRRLPSAGVAAAPSFVHSDGNPVITFTGSLSHSLA
jgi:hypothetical protein